MRDEGLDERFEFQTHGAVTPLPPSRGVEALFKSNSGNKARLSIFSRHSTPLEGGRGVTGSCVEVETLLKFSSGNKARLSIFTRHSTPLEGGRGVTAPGVSANKPGVAARKKVNQTREKSLRLQAGRSRSSAISQRFLQTPAAT